jgi:hypothetical protein
LPIIMTLLDFAWLGPAWPGLVRLGPAWPGLVRLGPAWPGLDRLGPAWPGLAQLYIWTLNGVYSPNEANYCSDPFEIFFLIKTTPAILVKCHIIVFSIMNESVKRAITFSMSYLFRSFKAFEVSKSDADLV